MSGPMTALRDEDVEWVVSSYGELGVKIGDQMFFLYKGESLQMNNGTKPSLHDDGSPLLWRHVEKREFGESCQVLGRNGDGKYDENGKYIHGEDWKEIPMKLWVKP